MKCYISGPMAGQPQLNFPAFFKAEEALQAAGWETMNPARHEGPMEDSLGSRRYYARHDLSQITEELRAERGDAIVLLDGWQDSKGSKAEKFTAEWVGLHVFNLREAIAYGEAMRLDVPPLPEHAEPLMIGESCACGASPYQPCDPYADWHGQTDKRSASQWIEPHNFHPAGEHGDIPVDCCQKCGRTARQHVVDAPGEALGITRVRCDCNRSDILGPVHSIDGCQGFGLPKGYSAPSESAISFPFTTNMVRMATTEQKTVIDEFVKLLVAATADGGRKRAAGTKAPWWRDTTHEAAIFSHLNKWKHGEKADGDNGGHPLASAAWRCLAIAFQETVGQVDPEHWVETEEAMVQ